MYISFSAEVIFVALHLFAYGSILLPVTNNNKCIDNFNRDFKEPSRMNQVREQSTVIIKKVEGNTGTPKNLLYSV
jgi:hypothetical protein